MIAYLKKRVKDWKRKDIEDAYRSVFESAKGRIVLEDLANIGWLCDTTFHSDPQQMAMREGARRTVLHILNMMNRDVFDYITGDPQDE